MRGMTTRKWIPEMHRHTEAAPRFSPTSWVQGGAGQYYLASEQGLTGIELSDGDVVWFCWEDQHHFPLPVRVLEDGEPGGKPVLHFGVPREDPLGTLYAVVDWPGFPRSMQLARFVLLMGACKAELPPAEDGTLRVPLVTRCDAATPFVFSRGFFVAAPTDG